MVLALYRRYRPDTLLNVIGQEHVIEPLSRAIDSGNVHHAYLFSGPRGCGKTSTARIMARSLNCEQGPTSNPCGKCESCIALAPGGSGSVDVVEIDAATHGGVDDARELREQVSFVPIKDRFKIYIIDEAHQLSTAANNAMLKMIEEPPSHLKFIFATTEPEKILGTIRSRTHNYSFRLVNKEVLAKHLQEICEQEKINCEKPALLAIAEASGGSVRDALSLLGQFSAGMDEKGLSTQYVDWQLGLTPLGLLEDLSNSISENNLAKALENVRNACAQGIEPHRLLSDFLNYLGKILRATNPNDKQLIGSLIYNATSISTSISQLKSSSNPELSLDLAISKLFVHPNPIGASTPAVVKETTNTEVQPVEKKIEKVPPVKAALKKDITDVKELEIRWSDIMGELARINRVAWLCFMDSKPLDLNQTVLKIGIQDASKVLQASESKWQEHLKTVLKLSLNLTVSLEIEKLTEVSAGIILDEQNESNDSFDFKDGLTTAMESLGAVKIDEFENEK
jgi:DNA polymerase III subunit gamma/tau